MTSVGCGAKEKVAEEVIENAVGDNVDIDGDKITIEGEDGEKVTIGETEWPDSDMAKKIPEFKNGKITSVISTENAIMVSIEETDDKEVMDYASNFVKTYLNNAVVMRSVDGLYYSGTDDQGLTIVLSYTSENKSLSITANQGEAIASPKPLPEEEILLLSDIALGDLKIPKKGMAAKLPSIDAGNIKSINYSSNSLSIAFGNVEKDDFEKYYNDFKGVFSKDSAEMKDAETVFYYASGDDVVSASLNYNFKEKSLDISISK